MRIAVIGASNDRRKYGNRAVRAYLSEGYTVVPVNPRDPFIEGLPAYASVLDVPGPIDVASFYVPPDVGLRVLEQVAARQIPEVWLNPGSDREDVIARAHALAIRPVVACSILAVGQNPGAY